MTCSKPPKAIISDSVLDSLDLGLKRDPGRNGDPAKNGDPGKTGSERDSGMEGLPFIQKPFTVDGLLGHVRAALDAR
jgi:hypothetical protein